MCIVWCVVSGVLCVVCVVTIGAPYAAVCIAEGQKFDKAVKQHKKDYPDTPHTFGSPQARKAFRFVESIALSDDFTQLSSDSQEVIKGLHDLWLARSTTDTQQELHTTIEEMIPVFQLTACHQKDKNIGQKAKVVFALHPHMPYDLGMIEADNASRVLFRAFMEVLSLTPEYEMKPGAPPPQELERAVKKKKAIFVGEARDVLRCAAGDHCVSGTGGVSAYEAKRGIENDRVVNQYITDESDMATSSIHLFMGEARGAQRCAAGDQIVSGTGGVSASEEP